MGKSSKAARTSSSLNLFSGTYAVRPRSSASNDSYPRGARASAARSVMSALQGSQSTRNAM